MATMVARGSTELPSSVPHQENGHRNKRKFRSEPPVPDPNRLAQPQADNPVSYGFPPVELNAEQHHGGVACDLCSSMPCPADEELDVDDFPDADWNVPTEVQLKELLLGNLDAIFRGVVRKIASQGYTEEDAKEAVLRLGPCYGSKDTVSSIVDNALAFLAGSIVGQDAPTDNCFEDLRRLEEHVLSEMVGVLRDVRPFFSSGDAMWCLLICDMNVSHACAMDGDTIPNLAGDDMAFPSSLPQMKPEESNPNAASPRRIVELNCGRPHFSLCSQAAVQNELPPVAGIPNLPPVKIPSFNSSNAASMDAAPINPNPAKENLPSLVDCVIEGFSSTGTSEAQPPAEKLINGKRCNGVGISRRDPILRQKSIHLEKGCRAHRNKGSVRSGKLSNLGSLIDRKSRSSSDAAGVNLKNSMLKKSRPLGPDALQGGEATPALSFSAGSSARLPLTLKTDNSMSQLPAANTELSLSLPSISTISRSNNTPDVLTNGNGDVPNYCNNNGFPSDKVCRQWVFQERKDEVVHKLVPRVRELQTQLQEWSEWAQQKVMQAARRLSKDKAELQTLRQEKEEVSRLKKEKQSLEENTVKKLSEMESALSKAGCQVDKANAAIRRLEVENAHLRQQMEAAKLRDAKSAANCQEISKREMMTLKTFQSWDRQRAQFHDELMIDKHKLSQLQQQYDEDKACLDQLEARSKQEEKMRDDALMLAQCERKEREQMEVSAKSKEDTLRLKAENDLLLHKDDMRKLENQIAQLRLKTDASKIAALRQGVNSTYASRLAQGLSSSLKDTSGHYASQLMDLQESVHDEVQRERECVMCLTEEMSVVFLPCAHQVVCGTCNKLHEQQGMKDCPSCRTPIKQRITVHSARS